MKPILYVGAALMIGAAVYGFADFKKTNASREFRNLYEEKEALQPAVASGKEQTDSRVEPVMEKKEIVAAPATEPKKEKLKLKTSETISGENEAERELSSELFSRAPLREAPKVAIKEMKKTKTAESKTDQ